MRDLAGERRPLSSSSILATGDTPTACVIRCRYPSRRRRKRGTEMEQRNESGRVSHRYLEVKPWEITITSPAEIKDMSEMNNATTCNGLYIPTNKYCPT